MSWVLDSHVLKDLTIGTQNIVRLGPHQPPLFHHRPRSLVSITLSLSREGVCGDVLKPHRRHHHCDLIVKSPPARSLKVHVEVHHKNHLCPHWPLHHLCQHTPNRCVVKWCQVTVRPIALSCVCFYRPTMVIIVAVAAVVVVAVFVNVVTVIVLGEGRPPNGPLSPCHPPNGENTKDWV